VKFFIDTANVDEIREAASFGIVDGVTTNPTLLAREIKHTGKKPHEILKEICEIVDGPVTGEATSLDAKGIVKEGKELSKIAKNICIKVPMGKEGIKAIRTLTSEGIMTNATLVFSSNQALLVAKAGATFVSPFVGRLDDIGHTGLEVAEEIIAIYENYDFETEVIVASVRHPLHVRDAALMGADVATIPFNVMEKLFKHPLTDVGIQRFLKDWEEARKIYKE
jgi:transaldolase